MSTHTSQFSNSPSDHHWDAFVASLHRVWEYAPDFSPTGPTNLSGRIVLLIDQDAAHNEQLCDHLKRLGAAAIAAGTLEDGLRELTHHSIELIVLGTNFGDETALRFCREVCDASRTMHIPIIVLADDASPEMVWQARREGAKFYLRKPYDPYVLLTLMSAALEPLE
ncbi:MAG: response regulator [Pirellulaceae bacterium]|nr:response regulator [Pirellulaceae bacterium]